MIAKRKIKRVCVWALAILAIAIFGGVTWIYQTVAPVSGEFTVPNLQNKVTITFDQHQRPFVLANTLNDALFAEGWLHASHRLWQMEMFRRAGKGRLAELLGASMLQADQEMWRMGVPQLGVQLEANASQELNSHVAAYVNGINAAIASGVSSPPEFLVLNTMPAPWTSSDVFALGALMAFQSANNSSNELLRLALLNELGSERASIFMPDDVVQADFPYVLPGIDTAKILRALDRKLAVDPLENPLMPRFAMGSNGWVVAPAKSKTGNALFAFDSHDSFGLPNLFYEVHLFFADDRQIRGWSVAGLPGVVNGYNERIAWGFTNIGDTQDLFLETRSPADPLQFKEGEDWYTAETEIVEIPVNGRDKSETLTIVHTRNGPLISDDPPISLSWTVQHLDGRGLDSILEYNQARSCQEFADTLDRFAAPSLNATFVDIEGNIGFRTAGLIPIRGHGLGLVPLDGSKVENRWQGFVPMEELPETFNPLEGFLAAANARVHSEDHGPMISSDNAPGYRIRRIQSVLSERDDLTAEEMQALQVDWYDTQAELLMPAMIDSVAQASLTSLEKHSLELLQRWQGDWVSSPGSGAAIIFQAWYRALAVGVFKPELSQETFEHLFRSNYPLNHALDRLILRESDNPFWRGKREAIITSAFTAAVAEIRDVQGDDISTWRLDRMHKVKLEHELGKAVPQLSWIFNVDPAPWGGGTSTVGRARYRYDHAYDATAGATIRVVGKMEKPAPEMAAVILGGQSGHPFSHHYSDQASVWLGGMLLPIADSPSDVVGTLITLLPEAQ